MNRTVELSIDTSQTEKTVIILTVDGAVSTREAGGRVRSSQSVLPLIESVLSDKNLKLSDITAIRVATGPGSFTGLRIGAAVAQMLGVLLGVPVNGRPADTLPTLDYTGSKWE